MDNKNLMRAIKYAISIVSFQDVGTGSGFNLGRVRAIVSEAVDICKNETGIELDNYPTDFLYANAKLINKEKLIPYTFLKILGEDKETKCFSVDSKDLFDKKKNPKLSLSPKEILKNKKIKKKEL